jgi:DNA-binding NtrC family response regulator
MIMPHLSGIDLVKHLRAVRPGIPVALTSGRFDIGAGSTFDCERINVRISKPATIEELNGALAALLPDNEQTG